MGHFNIKIGCNLVAQIVDDVAIINRSPTAGKFWGRGQPTRAPYQQLPGIGQRVPLHTRCKPSRDRRHLGAAVPVHFGVESSVDRNVQAGA